MNFSTIDCLNSGIPSMLVYFVYPLLIASMTEFSYRPKVIMRTSIGSTNPLNGGVQHTQDYTKEMKTMLKEVKVVLLDEPEDIMPQIEKAYHRAGSTLLIEHGDYYNDK